MPFIPPLMDEQELLDDPLMPLQLRKELLSELDRTNQELGVYKESVQKIFRLIDQHLSHLPYLRILEVGSGSGGLAREILKTRKIQPAIEYHVLDMDLEILRWIQTERLEQNCYIIPHVSGDTHLKQFPNGHFDLIISLQTVHHIQPMEQMRDFFQDVLKKSKHGFWIADFERRPFNMLFYSLAKYAVKVDSRLAEDGKKSLRRSYTMKEWQSALGSEVEWKFYWKRYWLNPFMTASGIKKWLDNHAGGRQTKITMFWSPPQINEQEILDDPTVPLQKRKDLMLELDVMNQRFGIYKNVIREISGFLHQFSDLPKIRLLEVGSGSGGLAREILKSHQGPALEYHIMDEDPEILKWVQEMRKQEGLHVVTHEAGSTHLKQLKDQEFDFIICLQVVHHIHPQEIMRDFFKDVLAKTRHGFWIADFERRFYNRIPHFLFNTFAGSSKDLRSDGLRSLRRAYTLQEIKEALPENSEWNFKFTRHLLDPFMIATGIRKK